MDKNQAVAFAETVADESQPAPRALSYEELELIAGGEAIVNAY